MRCGLVLLIAYASAGAERNPDEVLAQLTRIVRGQAARIVNYACVETIDRQYYRPTVKSSAVLRSCADVAQMKNARGYRLVPADSDRFRLDVRVGADAEMYSWPGANRFDDRSLRDIIGFGPSGSGVIGPVLAGVFSKDGPGFLFEGEKDLNGRKALAWSFHVPREQSANYFYIRGGETTAIAYEGTVLADDAGEPVELTIRAVDMPPETDCCRFSSTLKYRRVRIGDSDLLLPYEALQRFVLPTGTEVENTVSFASCREYRAESTVSFGRAPVPAQAEAAPPAQPLNVPAGLPVTVALTGRIDSAAAAAGDPFIGRLVKPVAGQDGTVFAPAGAVVHGRIVQVARAAQPATHVTIQLRIETIAIDGRELPFRVIGKGVSAIRPGPLRSRGVAIGDLPRLSGGGVVFVECSGRRCVMAEGFRTEWVTLP